MELLVSVLCSTGVTSIVLACLNRYWAKKDKHDERIDALVDAQKVLMIDRVRHLGQSYIDDQQITLDDKENLEDMYKSYKALGGNGHLDTVMSEVESLPVVTRCRR